MEIEPRSAPEQRQEWRPSVRTATRKKWWNSAIGSGPTRNDESVASARQVGHAETAEPKKGPRHTQGLAVDVAVEKGSLCSSHFVCLCRARCGKAKKSCAAPPSCWPLLGSAFSAFLTTAAGDFAHNSANTTTTRRVSRWKAPTLAGRSFFVSSDSLLRRLPQSLPRTTQSHCAPYRYHRDKRRPPELATDDRRIASSTDQKLTSLVAVALHRVQREGHSPPAFASPIRDSPTKRFSYLSRPIPPTSYVDCRRIATRHSRSARFGRVRSPVTGISFPFLWFRRVKRTGLGNTQFRVRFRWRSFSLLPTFTQLYFSIGIRNVTCQIIMTKFHNHISHWNCVVFNCYWFAFPIEIYSQLYHYSFSTNVTKTFTHSYVYVHLYCTATRNAIFTWRSETGPMNVWKNGLPWKFYPLLVLGRLFFVWIFGRCCLSMC